MIKYLRIFPQQIIVMKKTIYSLFLGSILFIGGQILLTSSSNGRAFSANDGNTGAPGEGQTCRSCHTGGQFRATVNIIVKDSSGFPVTNYVPGKVYDVDVAISTTSAAQRYGFQLVTLTSNAIPYNAWSQPSANTRIANAGQRSYAEHKGKSVSSLFSTKWTAPVAGTGDIVFYAGGAAVNNNGSTSGDDGDITSLTLIEDISTSSVEYSLENVVSFFPIPAEDYFYVKNTSGSSLNGVIRIIDIQGKIISEVVVNASPNGQVKIDVNQLKSGIYMVQLTSSNQSVLNKRIVIR